MTLQSLSTDDPITLDEACERFRGRFTVATLRAEARRGNLVIFKLGRRNWTTLAYVHKMIADKCHHAEKARDSISTHTAEPGPSGIGDVQSAQAALQNHIARRKKRSPSTSQGNIVPLVARPRR